MSDTTTVDTSAAGQAAAPAAEPVTPNITSLNDDALVAFKIGDKTENLPWKDIRSGHLMHQDYTRKTQELGKLRSDFDTERQSFAAQKQQFEQQLQQLRTTVADPEKLAALYLASVANKNAGQQRQPTPEEIINYRLQQQQQEFDQRFTAFEQAQAASKIEDTLGSYLGSLLKDQPVLASIDGIDEAIFGKVIAMNPTSLDEAKQYTKMIVEGNVSKLGTAYTESKKAEAAAKQQALRGIEPRGGQAKLPEKRTYKGPDDPQRDVDAAEYLKAMFFAEDQ